MQKCPDVHQKTCILVFPEALFIKASNWKLPTWPAAAKWKTGTFTQGNTVWQYE